MITLINILILILILIFQIFNYRWRNKIILKIKDLDSRILFNLVNYRIFVDSYLKLFIEEFNKNNSTDYIIFQNYIINRLELDNHPINLYLWVAKNIWYSLGSNNNIYEIYNYLLTHKEVRTKRFKWLLINR